MTHSFVNIVAPIALSDVLAIRAQIGSLLDNPANAATSAGFGAMDGELGIHFASMHALAGSDGKRGHIFLEFTADGDGDVAIQRLAAALPGPLSAIFENATDWQAGNDLGDYLKRHSFEGGFGLFDAAGCNFAGTPGMTVGRIRREAALRRRVETAIAAQPVSLRPIEQVRAIRADLANEPEFKWALDLPEPLDRTNTKYVGGVARYGSVAVSLVKTYLWPALIPIVLVTLWAAMQKASVWAMWTAAMSVLMWGGLIAIGLGLAFLVWLYRGLRTAEESDWLGDRTISRTELTEILKRENHFTQNHMISHTALKPGFMRRCVSKLALFAIGTLTPLNGRPGFLDKIGTIHFARWVTLPGTRDYIFVSNFDGSWESYLEDFITKAHAGLTAAWSCTMGFPYTKNLFQLGATDGERFKRFARHSMVHTAFWYNAYPDISTDQIRVNASIRRAIAIAESDEEAGAMLSLFGSVVRPPEKFESNQIQSIVFGGLGQLPHGVCQLINLSADQAKARAWLAGVLPEMAFSDGRHIQGGWVATCAFGPAALERLGLPRSAISSFPAAFLDGMTAPGRDRILGDPDAKTRDAEWWWGQTTPHIALLLYAADPAGLAKAKAAIASLNAEHGAVHVHEVALAPVESKPQERKEPFGFVDGISQPLIKGTYKATRDPDPIHLVEPGEFILGYPDNRGNLPPVPRMDGRCDAAQQLPIGDGGWNFDASIGGAERDIGRNGSYLVIRQLEQHVDAFHAYCAKASKDVMADQKPGYAISPDQIEAKMVGRWHDGSPLVRWPYESETDYRKGIGSSKLVDPDNSFDYGTEDPQATRCPFGSHVRRTNPRDSQLPGERDQIDISNRHRILRMGRGYAPKAGQDPGILFMCLNGDIERQFEFIQQTWAMSGHFHGLDGEADPLLAAVGAGSHYTIPSRNGPIRLTGLPRFVTTRGGGYFFLPGRKLVEFLSNSIQP